MKNLLLRLWRLFLHYRRFVRWAALSFSLILPLLGAGTVAPTLMLSQILGLIGVALTFHHFGYVLNDVVDLPVDRLHPGRTRDLLVQGIIKPWQALAFALLQLPLAFLINHWLSANRFAMVVLATAFSASAIYNLWGKRLVYPVITDIIQGLAWAGLALYGVAIVNRPLTGLTWQLLGFVTLYIMLINGVHASLRDLGSDSQAGMKTTAIWLGARVDAPNHLHIPAGLRGYLVTLQVMLLLLLFWPLATNTFGYSVPMRAFTFTIVLLLQIICLYCNWLLLNPPAGRGIVLPVMAYIVLSLLSLLVLYAPALTVPMRVSLFAVYFFPLLVDWLLVWGKFIPAIKS